VVYFPASHSIDTLDSYILEIRIINYPVEHHAPLSISGAGRFAASKLSHHAYIHIYEFQSVSTTNGTGSSFARGHRVVIYWPDSSAIAPLLLGLSMAIRTQAVSVSSPLCILDN
jgi:hypothetical protein